MTGTIRQSFAWLHTWAGLLFGWILFAIFLTGTLAVFEKEITHWMTPELRPALRADAASPAQAVEHALTYLRHAAPASPLWRIMPSSDRAAAVEVRWRAGPAWVTRFLDPTTGTLLPARETEGGAFFTHFHFELHAGTTGVWIVGAAGMAMLVVIIAGVVIHKRIFRDFFTFRPAAAAQRAWLDAHNTLGVLALPFHLMIAYTGLMIFYGIYMPAGVQLLYDGSFAKVRADLVQSFDRPRANRPGDMAPIGPMIDDAAQRFQAPVWLVVIRNPGDAHATVETFRGFGDRVMLTADRVAYDATTGAMLGAQHDCRTSARIWRTMVGLHSAQFGGVPMRWLYFLCGAASCALIATGLVLYTAKRRRAAPARFDRIAEAITIATVAGGMLACAAYLWGNRLLPHGLAARAPREAGVFFASWGAALVHALGRPPARAWPEQLGLVAALCAGLPVVNAATTGVGLPHALARGDLVTAGVDLAALAIGLVLAGVAGHVARKTPAGAVSLPAPASVR